MNPESLGRYQIRGEIGRGNMGVVYLAYDPVIDRPLALKTILLPDSVSPADRETYLQRFFQEVRTAGKLTHPNVVVTHDAAIDEATGTPFIAMELVEGESLAERLRREGPVPWERAVEWAAAIALALHQAHRQGIVHRDVKPANVMVTREGVAKITDFGIAKLPNAQLTQTGVVIGTPYFMSPEQLKGETVDGRSDLFSLGALLYNLVSGSRPFQGEEVAAVASQVLYKDPHPLSEVVPGVPAALDGVLGRALAKPPAERYASGEELAADLAAVRQGETPQGAPSVAERTQTSGAVAAPRGMDASAELPVLELEDAPAVDDSKVAPTARASVAVASPRRRLALWGALSVLLGLSLLSAVVFRQEIAEREQLFVASRAASNGELARSEEILETLLESNPELASARDLLGEVSGQLVGPMLPIELSVKHRHRFGSCSGRLTLSDDGVVFSSKSHGTWRWPFEHIRAFGARGAWEISLQTDEDDMLGLLDEKNYNFSLLGEAIDEDVAKRYERLYQYRRDRPTGL